jgi:flagellar protein FlgJ
MERVAAEFESVFLSQILRGMTQGLAGAGLAADGDDPFGSMLQDEYAKLISRSGGIGLADSILREMLKMQEAGP